MSIQNGFGSLRRVYVRALSEADVGAWADYGWHAPPEPDAADAEHAAFRAELERAGSDVIVGATRVPGDPDAIYAYDPLLLTDEGLIVLRPGKEGRRDEPEALATDLAAAGLALRGHLEAPATAEGGDMFFLDERTLLVGVGYRTNEAAVAQLRTLLPDIDVIVFDLPHLNGPPNASTSCPSSRPSMRISRSSISR